MTAEPCSSHPVAEETHPSPLGRIVRFTVRLPFVTFGVIVRGLLYSAWYLAFYVLCMFRPFTGMMVLAAIVMLPMSIVVFAHPEAARGMPFWAFGLMGLGFVAFALGYTLFVDWITPPGAEDPFERYRRRPR
ncbi:hypothetical protein O9X99_19855 [Agrobacterium salinitolerans]|uniref:Uncharacterized protein n=1 Tax=Agrobacterium salinitolerans TaxID=1183413 RepID=A0A9X3R2D6_9HYPH|nr:MULTISPECIES: hypothetical protein [Agrobacterium]MCZ7854670.1 hypothetical protein [Agrobacterium salinitolerans]MCZ7893929.1 hypothetical protein [Agrobacterium salinitolerans]MCZ7939880.1 hypothetical protein [Agrobacterium salinitolerans]